MKTYLLAALLCFLLCGCAQEPAPSETTPPIAEAAEEAIPAASMYAPGHPLEIKDVLRVYPLSLRKVQGMRAFDDGVLVLSGYGNTTLTLLTGEELTVTASLTLDFQLASDDPSLRIHGSTVSFFDPVKQETVVLDEALTAIRHVAAPEDLLGAPILSADRSTLYYSTPTAIRAWDLESGIRRVVKEMAYETQQLVDIHLEGSLLQCRISDGANEKTLFLSADTGLLQQEWDGSASLVTAADRYYASLPIGNYQALVFGSSSIEPTQLLPAVYTAHCTYLPDVHGAITTSEEEDGSVRLDYYALGSGICQADLSLPALQDPKAIVSGSGNSVYILTYDPANDCDTIYHWVIPQGDGSGKTFLHPYQSSGTPDADTLSQCRSYAAALSSKFGIDILIGEEALAVQPWDYEFTVEEPSALLLRELELLDQRLSQYPQEVLSATASHFTALKIALVRQVSGTPASGSLDTATGIQFFDGTDAYVAITVGKYAEQALYHELFHVMETHLLNETPVFDDWDSLNPDGFAYGNGYALPQAPASYLEGETRAFIDTYSMSFPKEDRARVMEYSMLPGQEGLFASDALQGKLQKLCEGIRQAYGLRKSPETFPWEQYLEKSLAYTE